MKIPKGLPQFKGEHALIIVAGKQDAALYHAFRGEIEYIGSIKVDKPQFSSEKGHFKTRGHGSMVRSGTLNQVREETIIREFTHKLADLFKGLRHRFPLSSIYLLSPGKVREKIKSTFPYQWRSRLRQTIAGNYFYFHPIKVLERIA